MGSEKLGDILYYIASESYSLITIRTSQLQLSKSSWLWIPANTFFRRIDSEKENDFFLHFIYLWPARVSRRGGGLEPHTLNLLTGNRRRNTFFLF